MMDRRGFIAAAAAASAGLSMTPDARADSAGGGGRERDSTVTRLQECLARHRVPGASVAVLRDGELSTAAAGVVNVSTGVELTPDTVMHIGSITKVLNTTLVMQLVDEGRVDLDERIVRYLPDLKLRDRGALERITVRMLLNHTCGIDGNTLPDRGHDEETIENGIRRLAELGQLHPPGAEYSYSNAGMAIAGYLAQRLTGRSWYRLVRERIFEPLQMTHAAALPEEALLHRASVGHYLDAASGSVRRTSHAFLPLGFAPAGASLMMSARDLVKFASAHMAQGVGDNGTRILSAAGVRAMQQVTVNNAGKGYVDENVGLGWMISPDGLLSHAGGGPGIIAQLFVLPERRAAVAVLTNAAHGVRVIDEWMAPWFKDHGVEPVNLPKVQRPSQRVSIDPGRYVGVYENVMDRFLIAATPDGLTLSSQAKYALYENVSLEPTPPKRLIALGDDRFLLERGGGNDRLSDAPRVFAFRGAVSADRMRYLGLGGRLYPKVS